MRKPKLVNLTIENFKKIKPPKKQRKIIKRIRNKTEKILQELMIRKNIIIDEAIKNYMQKNKLTDNDLKNYGISEKYIDGSEIYKYKDDIIIKIQVIYKNKKIIIKPESEYLNDPS